MSNIPLEDALSGLQEREDAVRLAIAELDKDMAELRDMHSLPVETKKWARIFATRVASVNKEYRVAVKQDLQSAAHNMKHLYGEGGDGDNGVTSVAMRTLVSMITGAFLANRRMNTLLAQCIMYHDQLAAMGQLALIDRVFMRRSLPDLLRCGEKLGCLEEQVKIAFDSLKPSLYVIAYEPDLKRIQGMLSARKLTRSYIEQQARPAFNDLAILAGERASILEQSVTLAIDDGVAWCHLPDERVPVELYERELVKYDDLRDRVLQQKAVHDVAVATIKTLCGSAMLLPRTLPDAHGKELQIAALRLVFPGYERICASCAEMSQLAEPVVETLREYAHLLRSSVLLANAFN